MGDKNVLIFMHVTHRSFEFHILGNVCSYEKHFISVHFYFPRDGFSPFPCFSLRHTDKDGSIKKKDWYSHPIYIIFTVMMKSLGIKGTKDGVKTVSLWRLFKILND